MKVSAPPMAENVCPIRWWAGGARFEPIRACWPNRLEFSVNLF